MAAEVIRWAWCRVKVGSCAQCRCCKRFVSAWRRTQRLPLMWVGHSRSAGKNCPPWGPFCDNCVRCVRREGDVLIPDAWAAG